MADPVLYEGRGKRVVSGGGGAFGKPLTPRKAREHQSKSPESVRGEGGSAAAGMAGETAEKGEGRGGG